MTSNDGVFDPDDNAGRRSDQLDQDAGPPRPRRRWLGPGATQLLGAGLLVTTALTAAFDQKLPPYKGD